MKKLLSILLALTMVLSLGVTAFADETGEENKSLIEKLGSGELFTVDEHTYQIETKTVPLYQGFSDADSTFEIELAFLDGETNVPYVSLETMKEMLYRWISLAKASEGGKSYDLEIEKNGDIVILTRENRYPVRINFAENTIEFYDYDAFIKISPDAPLMDVIASSGYDANGEPALFQKSDTSFERYGDPLTLKPGDYGIDLVYQDDEYYVPLQLISDFILTNYGGNVVYNTEAVCLVYIGHPEYLEDAFYPASNAAYHAAGDQIEYRPRLQALVTVENVDGMVFERGDKPGKALFRRGARLPHQGRQSHDFDAVRNAKLDRGAIIIREQHDINSRFPQPFHLRLYDAHHASHSKVEVEYADLAYRLRRVDRLYCAKRIKMIRKVHRRIPVKPHQKIRNPAI